MELNLTDNQKRIVAAGLTTLAGSVVIAAVVLFFVFSARFFQAFTHVFLPLAVAGVAAMVVDPWYGWLNSKLPSAVALVVVFLSLIVPLAVIGVFFGALIASQIADLLDQLPGLWSKMVSWIHLNRPKVDEFFKNSELGVSISETLKTPGGPTAALAGYLVESVASAGSSIASGVISLLGWVIVPVYLAFFLMMPRLRPGSLNSSQFPFLKTATAEDVIFLIREFFSLVVIFFRGQIVICLLQGILFAIGFSLAGLEYGAILGLMLGFLNIVPYLGSMLGLSVCLPMAWFQVGGGPTMLLVVIGVFCVVQAIEAYVLTPRIMGSATGLSPLAIIIGIFFWGSALDGILGMILAIPLTAFAVVLWRLAREKYIGQII